MPTNRKEFQVVYVSNQAEWRQWLLKNHTQKESVWAVLAKKGFDGLSRQQCLEEILCFGWIDSVANKLDDKRFKLLVSPRKPKSNWSAINKKLVAKLIRNKMMHEAGLAKIELAKKTGTWNALNTIDQLQYPPDLIMAFSKNKKAKSFFDAFPSSTKKGILEWILNAKTIETRSKRIAETVNKAEENIRANQYVRKA